MFQTWLELNKQIIRKAIDAFSGVAIGYLGTQGEWGAALVPVVVIAGNGLWFWIDNRNKVSVKGLQESLLPGTTNAAVAVEKALKEGKIDKAKGS